MRILASTEAAAQPGAAQRPWHVLPVDEVLGALNTASTGLTSAEAAERLARDGANALTQPEPVRPWRILLRQFKSLLIWLLLFAAAVSAVLGDWLDAAVIGAIVALNACVGAYQEISAERSIAALRKLAAPQAKAWRDGKLTTVQARDIVCGDVIEIEAGDLVPADARLLDSSSLRCVEASLTGESEAVSKHHDVLHDAALQLADRDNMVFLGTTVAGGVGRAAVVGIGMGTEIGRIARLLEELPPEATPLQRRLAEFGRVVIWIALGVIALLGVGGLLRGMAPMELLMTSVSLAVAAVPEGLPAVVTVALAIGVMRMVKRRALVRTLPAVETLGSTTVICTDKTGTLTLGEMTVRELFVAERLFHVTGQGYAPDGEVLFNGEVADGRHAAHLLELASVLVGSNNAHLTLDDGRWTVVGDPTEGALLSAGEKAGARRAHMEEHLPRHHEIPFDSDRKRRTIVRLIGEKRLRAYVNGAPELLLDRCTRIYTAEGIRAMTAADRARIAEANAAMAERALRVIGSAYRDIESRSSHHLFAEELEDHLVFVGLAGMQDPPRQEARLAVTECRAAGIQVVMITGDHPATALAIARDLGISTGADAPITGAELDAITDEELRARAPRTHVYARVTAEHKLRIIRAWKANGAVVAMTGDGVNDAPALKGADIGIAMGCTGTEVTKQAADLIITDDNFASIVAAVEEGRATYANIRKTLLYLLATNAGELLLMIGTIAVNMPLPLLPIHLLWINLVTDGPPALCLASDKLRKGLMNGPPRQVGESIANRSFLGQMAGVGFLVAGIAGAIFWYMLRLSDLDTARTFTFAYLVFAQLMLPFSLRRTGGGGGMPWMLSGVVAGLLILQMTLHTFAPFAAVLKATVLNPSAIGILLILGSLPALLVEIVSAAARPLRRRV